MLLNKLTKLLNITNESQIEKLTIIHELVTDRILTYIDETEIPKTLEWIVMEVTIKRFNLLGSEHLNSASVEGMNASYRADKLLDDYKEFLDGYLASKDEPKKASARKVKLL